MKQDIYQKVTDKIVAALIHDGFMKNAVCFLILADIVDLRLLGEQESVRDRAAGVALAKTLVLKEEVVLERPDLAEVDEAVAGGEGVGRGSALGDVEGELVVVDVRREVVVVVCEAGGECDREDR